MHGSTRLARSLAAAALAAMVTLTAAGCATTSPDHEPASAVGVSTKATHRATPTPTPTPVVSITTTTETTPVPFAAQTVDDPQLAKGATRVVTAGVDGVTTTTFEVTTTDGVETGRRQVSEAVTTQPVNQVTAVGTYVAPPPPPPAKSTTSGTGTVIPGGFCPTAQRGVTAVAANGRSYTCGGKGPDASGHLHWNV